VNVLASHGFEPLTVDRFDGFRRRTVIKAWGRFYGFVLDATVEGMAVEGSDTVIVELKSVLAVPRSLADDVYDVGALGPTEVGESVKDFHHVREGGPTFLIQLQTKSLRLVAEDEG
jgi:hypothetical protein